MSAAALLALAVVAQPGGERIDPALPDAVRPAVQSAIDAELDPKRGPSNAQAVLDAAMAKHQASNDLVLALRLRHAAIELRRILVRDDALPEPIRYEKAYTTFARLDLTDPGAKAWLERTLDDRAAALVADFASRRQPRADIQKSPIIIRVLVASARAWRVGARTRVR